MAQLGVGPAWSSQQIVYGPLSYYACEAADPSLILAKSQHGHWPNCIVQSIKVRIQRSSKLVYILSTVIYKRYFGRWRGLRSGNVPHAAWSDDICSNGLGDLMAPPYPNHLMHAFSHAKLQEVRTWVNTGAIKRTRLTSIQPNVIPARDSRLDSSSLCPTVLEEYGGIEIRTTNSQHAPINPYRVPFRLEDYTNDQPATMSLGSVDLQLRIVLGGVPVFSLCPPVPVTSPLRRGFILIKRENPLCLPPSSLHPLLY
ncbi:hypothetical protein VNO77_19201 [Canavalia gladiata]|uniref:Uncharacterized protein n=1 Tax=Canavalia gladiata TaxID=3824 RepID=A0AAN9QKA5_CANGL